MSLQEVFDMPWNEFVLRSHGFAERQKHDARMSREIAYQVYKLSFLMSKKEPSDKETFWGIDGRKEPKQAGPSPEAKASFMAAFEKYKSERSN